MSDMTRMIFSAKCSRQHIRLEHHLLLIEVLGCLTPLPTIFQLYCGVLRENHWPITSHWHSLWM